MVLGDYDISTFDPDEEVVDVASSYVVSSFIRGTRGSCSLDSLDSHSIFIPNNISTQFLLQSVCACVCVCVCVLSLIHI